MWGRLHTQYQLFLRVCWIFFRRIQIICTVILPRLNPSCTLSSVWYVPLSVRFFSSLLSIFPSTSLRKLIGSLMAGFFRLLNKVFFSYLGMPLGLLLALSKSFRSLSWLLGLLGRARLWTVI